MPIRVRRLIFHAVVLLAISSLLLPVLFYWAPSIWNDQGFFDQLEVKYLRGNYADLAVTIGFLVGIVVLLIMYAATLGGLFFFQTWSRLSFSGFVPLLVFLWGWRYWINPEWDFFLVRLAMHLVFALLLLACVWTPFVGGEFRRTARDL